MGWDFFHDLHNITYTVSSVNQRCLPVKMCTTAGVFPSGERTGGSRQPSECGIHLHIGLTQGVDFRGRTVVPLWQTSSLNRMSTVFWLTEIEYICLVWPVTCSGTGVGLPGIRQHWQYMGNWSLDVALWEYSAVIKTRSSWMLSTGFEGKRSVDQSGR